MNRSCNGPGPELVSIHIYKYFMRCIAVIMAFIKYRAKNGGVATRSWGSKMGDSAVGDERQLKSVAVHKSPAHVLPVCEGCLSVCVLTAMLPRLTIVMHIRQRVQEREKERDRRGASVFLICGLTV